MRPGIKSTDPSSAATSTPRIPLSPPMAEAIQRGGTKPTISPITAMMARTLGPMRFMAL